MGELLHFDEGQISTVAEAGAVAEELVAEAYKMSAAQWRQHRYDVKTLSELSPEEVAPGRLAHLVRYAGKRRDSALASAAFDFYRICLMDHSMLSALASKKNFTLFPLAVYVLCHELVHVVRFSRFLHPFETPWEKRDEEEKRVHEKTLEILGKVRLDGLSPIVRHYGCHGP